MMTRQQIKLAVKQAKYVRNEYPEFWMMHEMMLSLNGNLDAMVEFAREHPEELERMQLAELKNG